MKLIIKIISIAILTISVANATMFRLAMSTDGKFVIATDGYKNAYLYDLDNKKVKQVNKDAVNMYSPNFIKNTHNFIYQNDKDTIVSIVDADNMKVIKTFDPTFKSYGQAINQDMTRYASTQENQLMLIMSIKNGKYGITGRPTPYGTWQPSFTPDQKYVIATSTYDGELWIWNSSNGHKVKSLIKNVGNTMNTISPDGKFVYAMSDNLVGTTTKYNLEDNQIVKFPNATASNKDNFFFVLEKSKQLPFLTYQNKPNGRTNFGFIDNDKVIVTYKGKNQPFLWAGLYDINQIKVDEFANLKPIKYLPLTKDPMKFITGDYKDNTDPRPNTTGYNTIFDTSVEAHKLVMAGGDGIMVYNYNPKDESLKLDWVGVPAKATESKEEKKGWFW
jgi:tricorn protease-like protein